MARFLDKAVGWAKGQVDELGRAYGEMNDRRLAVEDQMRSAAFNALPEPLKMRVWLAEAPKLRGPVQPEPLPPAPSKRRLPGGDPFLQHGRRTSPATTPGRFQAAPTPIGTARTTLRRMVDLGQTFGKKQTAVQNAMMEWTSRCRSAHQSTRIGMAWS